MKLLILAFALLSLTAAAADLSGHKLLITSVRTGDTEVVIADPTTGDLFNVSRSPRSEDLEADHELNRLQHFSK